MYNKEINKMSLADKFAMDMKSYFGTPLDSFKREKYSSVVDNNNYVRLSDRLHNGDETKRAKQGPFRDYTEKAVNDESVEKADHEKIPDEINGDRNPVENENKIPVKDASGRTKRKSSPKKMVEETKPEDMTGSGNDGGALAFSSKGLKAGALAFNEKELINQISSLKKGDKLGSGAMSTALLTTLIQTAPQIISAIKAARKAEGGAAKCTPKFAGAYDTFVKQLDPSQYDNLESLCKQIVSQKKNLKHVEGSGEVEIGTGKFGQFMSNAWQKLKDIYGSEGFKPIRNALKSAASNYANSYIDKTASKIADKTKNEDLKNIVNTTRDVVKNAANDVIDASGAGNDINEVEGAGNQEQKYLVHKQATAVENIQDDEYNTDDLVKKKEAKVSRKKRAISPDKGVSISHVNIGSFNKVPQKSVFL